MTRRIAQGLWWLGLLLIVGGAALVVAQVPGIPGLAVLGGGLAALAVNALLAGDIIIGPAPKPFSIRGSVVRGDVLVKAGLSDISMRSRGPGRIAQLQYGPFGQPGFEIKDGVAYLTMTGNLTNATDWEAELANNVLWDLRVQSSLGNQSLDLSGVRMEKARFRSLLGNISVACPQRGVVKMGYKTLLGRIELAIPEGIGADVRVKVGPLASLTVNNERLVFLDDSHLISEDRDEQAAQLEIIIEAGLGDVVLN
ncbi:MAG: hypothetical protein GYB68_07130 [Chloroflexi bacterium]|nr:hypothetical protein [Chloroflexota bacterium]